MVRSDTPRILIARMSAVGDTILTLPVACALRARFPKAFLGWVVEKRAAVVVRDHASLDAVIELQRGWFTSPRKILQARQRLRPFGFETSVDCQSVSKSALACWLSGAKQRIGCRGQYGCELSPLFNNHLVRPQCTHLTDRSLELLGPLEARPQQVDWQFPLNEASRQHAQRVVEHLGLGQGYAVINPGANWDSRLWEMNRFAAVARYLGRAHRLPTLVVWGNERELGWAREIVATAAGHACLAPPTSLIELGALIERARLFLSSDTGPLHLAVAVGTPSIALHGVTRPEDSGPYGAPHLAIQVEHQQFSRRQRKRADNSAMRRITPKLVNAHCDALLAAGGVTTSRVEAA